jgi:hypothetical protein
MESNDDVNKNIKEFFPITRIENSPIVIAVHGGGLITGNKDSLVDACESLRDNGIVCIAASYKLSSLDSFLLQKVLILQIALFLMMFVTVNILIVRCIIIVLVIFITVFLLTRLLIIEGEEKNRHPVHILDLTKTIHEISQRFPQSNIVLLGHSAGAHLVALAATNTKFILNIGGESLKDRIIGVVGISGVYSGKRLNDSVFARQFVSSVFSKTSGTNEICSDAFSINFITDKTPPFLIINSVADFSLLSHSADFVKKLRENNVYVETFLSDKNCHLSIKHRWSTSNKEISDKVTDFILARGVLAQKV